MIDLREYITPNTAIAETIIQKYNLYTPEDIFNWIQKTFNISAEEGDLWYSFEEMITQYNRNPMTPYDCEDAGIAIVTLLRSLNLQATVMVVYNPDYSENHAFALLYQDDGSVFPIDATIPDGFGKMRGTMEYKIAEWNEEILRIFDQDAYVNLL